jgi:hypothetical protein
MTKCQNYFQVVSFCHLNDCRKKIGGNSHVEFNHCDDSKYVFHWHHHFLYIVISINLAMICLCGYKHKFVMFSMTKKSDSYTEWVHVLMIFLNRIVSIVIQSRFCLQKKQKTKTKTFTNKIGLFQQPILNILMFLIYT